MYQLLSDRFFQRGVGDINAGGKCFKISQFFLIFMSFSQSIYKVLVFFIGVIC